MPKYIEVEIAVVVDTNGKWQAAGWHSDSDSIYELEAMNIASEETFDADDTLAKYWVTAELIIPEEREPIRVKASKVEKEGE